MKKVKRNDRVKRSLSGRLFSTGEGRPGPAAKSRPEFGSRFHSVWETEKTNKLKKSLRGVRRRVRPLAKQHSDSVQLEQNQDGIFVLPQHQQPPCERHVIFRRDRGLPFLCVFARLLDSPDARK